MKKSIEWSFNYLSDIKGINVLTGNKEEAEEEITIKCFNGYAPFSVKGKNYLLRYPTIQQLTNDMKEDVYDYCGYYPTSGEYGVIAGTFGEVIKI